MLTSTLLMIVISADPTVPVERNGLGIEPLIKVTEPFSHVTPHPASKLEPDRSVILAGFLAQPVAIVNGEEVAAMAILHPYGRVLLNSPDRSPERFALAVRRLIESNLRAKVEQILLCQELARRYPEEQLVNARQALVDRFNEHEVPRLQREYRAADPRALEVALRDYGTSLEDIRQQYVGRTLAVQAVQDICGPDPQKEVIQKTIADLEATASIQCAYNWKSERSEKR